MHNDIAPAVHSARAFGVRQFDSGRINGRCSRVRRKAFLYRAGDPVAECVFAIRYGSFKHYRADGTGAQKITCFPVCGDFLALDSIGQTKHLGTAVAMEDSEVCEIGYATLRQQPLLFHSLIRQNILDIRNTSLQLYRSPAEQRLATFLLRLSRQYGQQGDAPTRYRLPMSRPDIANYLHLAPESVSRLLHHFKLAGLILLENRDIVITDLSALEQMALANGNRATFSTELSHAMGS